MSKRVAKYVGSTALLGFVFFGISDVNATVTKTEEVEEPIKYTVNTIYDNNLREGTTRVDQEGKDGSKNVTYSVTYKYDKEIKRIKESEKVVKPAQEKKVVQGTKKYYKCSDGTEYDNIDAKNECEKKIAWTKQKDASLKECYADASKFNCWYDEYPNTTLHWTEYTYTVPSYSGSKGTTNTGGYRTGAICRDGWRSSATGKGACSHHGGVSYWL